MAETTDELLTLNATAKLLGIGPQRLHKWAVNGIGPRPVWIDKDGPGRPSKDGRSPRWTRAEVECWIAEVESGADAAADYPKDADQQVMAYKLAAIYQTIRDLNADEMNASVVAIHSALGELRGVPRVAAVWAAVGMALLADAKARGIRLDDLDEADDDAERIFPGMYL